MKQEIIEVLNDWKIPDELQERAYQLIEKFGLTFLSENMDYHLDYTKEYFDGLEKEMDNLVMFEAKDWRQMFDILNEIFQFSELEAFGLFDEEELMRKIENKELLHFYEDQEDKKTPHQVLCCKGYKMRETQKEWALKSYEKWQKDHSFWSNLPKN